MNGLSLRGTGVGNSCKKSGNNYTIGPLHVDCMEFSKFHNLSIDTDSFIKANNVTVQIELIKKLGEYIKTCNDFQVRNENLEFIIFIFLNSPLKHPLKNTCSKLLSCLHSLHCVQPLLFDKLSEIMRLADLENCIALNEICNSIYVCLEIFSIGDAISKSIMLYLKNVLQRYVDILRENNELSPTKKMELYSYIHNTSRSCILLLQKSYSNSTKPVDDFLKSQTNEISQICNFLLDHQELPMDTKGNCAIILILLLNLQQNRKTWLDIIKYVFQSCNIEENPYYYFEKSNTAKLVISNAVLNIIDLNAICSEEIDNISSFLYICLKFIDLSETSSTESTIILALARGFLLLSKYLSNINTKIAIEAANIILHFVWSYLDYYVDSVRHLSVQILTNIVKLSVLLDEIGNHEISSTLIKTIIEIPKNQALNFKALATLGSNYNCSHLLEKNPHLPQNMLININNFSDTSNISAAFEVLMMKHCKEVNTDVIFNIWIKPILNKLQTIVTSTDSELSSSILSSILLKAVKMNPQILQLLINSMIGDNSTALTDGHIKCMLICLNVARKSGYFDSKQSSNTEWKNTISYELLQIAVIHHVVEIRLLACSLIIESHKTSEYFTREEFSIIENFLKYNINVKSTNVHQKILSYTKKFLERWQFGYTKCIKEINSDIGIQIESENYKISSDLKLSYQNILIRLFRLCLKNIFPGANFSRRNISMQLLIWIHEIYNKQENKLIDLEWKEDNILLVYNFIDDSFECNKQLAVKLLTLIPTKQEIFHNDELWENTFLNTISKASNIKPTDCMSSAYKLEFLITKYPDNLLKLLKKLQFNPALIEAEIVHWNYFITIKYLLCLLKQEKDRAKIDILDAAANGPMYGLLYCIRHLLEKIKYHSIFHCDCWFEMIDEIIGICFEVNESVKPIVNNSSPEGHLPMDFNAGSSHIEGNGVILENGKSVTAQMVLLCAWRSVKEVSLLLGDISYGAKIVDKNEPKRIFGTITKQHLLDIGDHFITLLSETKHRGAFEQAYLGFSKLCSRLWKCESKDLHDLPHVWLNDLITAISSGDSKNSKLCATRRSAGVPFIIQALVTTELQVCNSPRSFFKCMSTLLQLAKFDETDNKYSVETRTHSLNILRALFRHASLGEYVNAYVADALITSINGFNGATWAERNSSTLLFSSLMTRIFGVQRTKDSEQLSIRNKMTGRIFFLRYPKLYDFFLNCLKTAVEYQDQFLQPSLYPVLLLLSRLYPSSLEGTDSNLQLINFVPYLILCSGNCVLKIRKLTAKAIVPLINLENYTSHILNIFTLLCIKNKSTNFQHGILLQLIRLLQYMPSNIIWSKEELEHLSESLKQSYWILEQITAEHPCFIIMDAYLDVISILIHKVPEISKMNNDFFRQISLFINSNTDKKSISLGKEQFYIRIMHLRNILSIENNKSEICSILTKNLTNNMYEIQSLTLNYLLNLYNAENIKEIEEKFEIGIMEKLFISKLSKNDINSIIKTLNNSSEYKQNLISSLSMCNNFQDIEKVHNLISYLPNSINDLTHFNYFRDEKILDNLLEKYESENEKINHVYLKHIENFMKQNRLNNDMQHVEMKKLLWILKDIPLEGEDVKKNITVDILIEIWNVMELNNYNIDNEIFEITILKWLTMLRLLNNGNEYILQHIRRFIDATPVIKGDSIRDYNYSENKTTELLLEYFVKLMFNMSLDHCIAMLVIFALGEDDATDDSLDDENLVFDKGSVNEIHEDCALSLLCLHQINKVIGEYSKQQIKLNKRELLCKNKLLIDWNDRNDSSALSKLLQNVDDAISNPINNTSNFKFRKLTLFFIDF